MDAQAPGGFLRHFRDLPDPRAKNIVHRLSDLLVIAVCAVLCGAEGWVDVELFGQAKLAWLKTFLELPGGIPSHDTFGRLFARLDPAALETCFGHWIAALQGQGQRHLAFDGKSIRRSFEHAWDKSAMAHLVSVFDVAAGVSLGQLAAEGKGGELGALRELLGLVALDESTVVTIDAGGCQRDIAGAIVAREADYILALKGNQEALHAKVKTLLDEAVLEGFAGLSHGHDRQVDAGHGRVETREVWVTDEIGSLGAEALDLWPALASVAVVEAVRETPGPQGWVKTTQRRYYISSLPGTDAAAFGQWVRGHWGIENQLHWQLDVHFGEDLRRVRKDHGAENFSRLCRIALNLLKADKATKAGIKGRRHKAGWDETYLLRLLTG